MFDRSELHYLRQRVIDLERQLETERAENRRVERHWGDMFLRRLGTFPVPSKPESTEPVAQPIREVTESDIGTYQAIKEEAQRLGKSTKDQEVSDWIREATGWTEEDIEKAIRSN